MSMTNIVLARCDNGNRNGTHCRRPRPKWYGLVNKMQTNYNIVRSCFLGAVTWSFSYGNAQQKIDDGKKYTSFAGHFDVHGNALVRYGVHCPIRKV